MTERFDAVLVPGLVAAIVLGTLAAFFGPRLMQSIRNRDILATGITAEARVVRLQDTGNRFNHQPEIAIHLDVTPKDGTAFSAVIHRVITAADADAFAPGRVLMVRFDPNRRERVILARSDP